MNKGQNPQFMGKDASPVFSGETRSETTRMMYSETPLFFTEQIRSHIPSSPDILYSLADIGAYKGELLGNIVDLLPEYKFKRIAVDVNSEALAENNAEEKFISGAEKLPFNDNSIDVVIMRYVLHWNSLEKQKQILKELSRVTRCFALIEHVGADIEDTEIWRERRDELLSGKAIPKLKRSEYFYSSRDEIESWMNQQGIRFERLRERTIIDASNALAERFGLDTKEAELARQILGNKNYLIQTDWLIFPQD